MKIKLFIFFILIFFLFGCSATSNKCLSNSKRIYPETELQKLATEKILKERSETQKFWNLNFKKFGINRDFKKHDKKFLVFITK